MWDTGWSSKMTKKGHQNKTNEIYLNKVWSLVGKQQYVSVGSCEEREE